ncbi:MAG: FKBP-type peptidyl-prolyl cis-trans isomerase [Saccharospirillaceae bacterium]|nr:FKBP-type peptidyl-prolyl cis-trans isomerase [Pseudomonadales bacterium]NRB78534.1 FKBP-type peptidyl-prolyl cis-trans isomerase [Saccharospirillaceae bacterium]
MQIKSFLLPIMMATTVSIVACSSNDDNSTQTKTDQTVTTQTDQAVETQIQTIEVKKVEAPLPTVFDTAELQLSYYIGFNVSSSILASESFNLDVELATQGIRDGANGLESSVSQEELTSADIILRDHFEQKAAAQNTNTSTDTSTATATATATEIEIEIEPTAEFIQAELDLSYYIGFNIASSVIASDSFEYNSAASIAGLLDGANGIDSQVTPEQLEAADAELRQRFEAKQAALNEEQMKAQALSQKMQMEQAESAKIDGVSFLNENATKEGVITTDSGLQFSVISKGDGTGISPTPAQSVEVHYHGTLIDGTVFDSSVERGESLSFPLNGVISGWTEGLQLMQTGDTFRFFIPSDLAYGVRATGSIPANSVLIFDVELISISAE